MMVAKMWVTWAAVFSGRRSLYDLVMVVAAPVAQSLAAIVS